MSIPETPAAIAPTGSTDSHPTGDVLLHRSWKNWVLLATTFVITSAGFGLVVATLLSDRIVSPWPWVRTDIALVLACVVLVLTLVLYLTREQRNLNRINRQLRAFREAVHESSRRRLYGLLNVSRIMGLHITPQAVFECITQSCLESFDCHRASLMLYDSETQKLIVRAASGEGTATNMMGAEQAIGEGVSGWVAQQKRALILGAERELKENPDLKLNSPSLLGAMVVPIILRDELVGVINVSTQSSDVAYSEDDLQALTVFAENAGACIRHAEQAEWMRMTIASLRRQVERANQETSI